VRSFERMRVELIAVHRRRGVKKKAKEHGREEPYA
jgi:hypothetical protein